MGFDICDSNSAQKLVLKCFYRVSAENNLADTNLVHYCCKVQRSICQKKQNQKCRGVKFYAPAELIFEEEGMIHLYRFLLISVTVLLSSHLTFSQDTTRFTPKIGYQAFKVREPVLTLKPGDVLISETLMGGYYTEEGGAWPGEVGPIYIIGATPKDQLVIKVIKVRTNREWGPARIRPGFGGLAADVRVRMLNPDIPSERFLWRLDRGRNIASLDLPRSKLGKIEVPMAPMLGRVAVAPKGEESFPGLWPGDFGGNMDAPEIKEGATVYLPIFHEGALFYFGDGHALQGEGEIAGTGLEATMDVILQFDLIKDKPIDWPRIENDEFIMVAASARPLIDAFRLAHIELIEWLEADYGFDRWEAYQVLSQVAESTVANIVDPQYTVVAKFPKKYLPK